MNLIVRAAAIAIAVFASHTAGAEPILLESGRIELPGVKGRIDHFSADLAGKRLFMAALGNDTVEVIDVGTGKVLQSLRGFQEPQGVLAVPDSARLIVANGQADKANIIDTQQWSAVAEVPLPEDSDNIRFDARSGHAWIGAGAGNDGALVAVDPASGKRVRDIALSGHPESFQLEQQGSRIFVNVPTIASIQVVDRESGKTLAKWGVPAAANFPMALDEASHRLFVGTRLPARLLVYDTVSGKVVASLPTVGDTDDLFYDAAARRVYVAGGEGLVQVYRQDGPDNYTAVESVPTRKGARTALFVPAWQKLFVALPRRGRDPAEIRVFSVSP